VSNIYLPNATEFSVIPEIPHAAGTPSKLLPEAEKERQSG
jgi:hypothetical protein